MRAHISSGIRAAFHAGAIATCSVGARAQAPAAVTAELSYAAAPSCPSEADFVAAVRARTDKVRFVSDPSATQRVSVRLADGAEGPAGMLVISDGERTILHRNLAASTCGEIASALALVAALALDPDAALEDDAPPPPPPPPPPPAPIEAPKAAPGGPRAPRTAIAVGAGAERITHVLPRAALAPLVFVDVEPGTANARVLAARLRIGLVGSSTSNDDPRPDSARFAWVALPVQICPVAAQTRSVALLPCASGEIGLLRARGTDVAEPTTHTRFWSALGLAASVRLRPADGWTVEATGGVRFPLLRDRFRFDPDERIYSPTVGSAFGLAVAVRLF
jgi:hypothetical protein